MINLKMHKTKRRKKAKTIMTSTKMNTKNKVKTKPNKKEKS